MVLRVLHDYSRAGRYLGDDEEMIAGRRAVLDKLGFEWRLRVHDSDVEHGNPEEFSVLCEGLQVFTSYFSRIFYL